MLVHGHSRLKRPPEAEVRGSNPLGRAILQKVCTGDILYGLFPERAADSIGNTFEAKGFFPTASTLFNSLSKNPRS